MTAVMLVVAVVVVVVITTTTIIRRSSITRIGTILRGTGLLLTMVLGTNTTTLQRR